MMQIMPLLRPAARTVAGHKTTLRRNTVDRQRAEHMPLPLLTYATAVPPSVSLPSAPFPICVPPRLHGMRRRSSSRACWPRKRHSTGYASIKESLGECQPLLARKRHWTGCASSKEVPLDRMRLGYFGVVLFPGHVDVISGMTSQATFEITRGRLCRITLGMTFNTNFGMTSGMTSGMTLGGEGGYGGA